MSELPGNSRRFGLLLVLTALATSACGDGAPVGPQPPTSFDPLSAFDGFHDSFDARYPYFVYKDVDWDAARDSFRPRAAEVSSVGELVPILEKMVEPLRDVHVKFVTPGGSVRPTYRPSRFVNWDLERWRETVSPAGWIERGRDWGTARFGDVGYLFIGSWNSAWIPLSEVEAVLEAFRETRALILDVRANGGGSDALAFDVAGRFATEEVLAGWVRTRDGPDHDDLGPMVARYLEPRGPWQYGRPVVVLAGRGCFSSNESFVAAMRELPLVTVMGDTTGGSSGNPATFALADGWSYTVPRWIAYTADRRIFEWQGIPPDVPLDLGPDDFTERGDPVLEHAVAWLGDATSERGTGR